MKKRNITIALIVVLLILTGFFFLFKPKTIILDEEDKNELLSVLGIEEAESFKFIGIETENLGFGDSTKCYTLRFELSLEDYDKCNLHYYDGDSPALSDNFRIKKDDNTYICAVREWEYHTDERKPVYEEIRKIFSKYYGIKVLKLLANALNNGN